MYILFQYIYFQMYSICHTLNSGMYASICTWIYIININLNAVDNIKYRDPNNSACYNKLSATKLNNGVMLNIHLFIGHMIDLRINGHLTCLCSIA